uniref:Uncharacterized protein n=1 Tax=Arion vulgaris TaxID=1028688 RepID=A0A0B7A546_9EUPU
MQLGWLHTLQTLPTLSKTVPGLSIIYIPIDRLNQRNLLFSLLNEQNGLHHL